MYIYALEINLRKDVLAEKIFVNSVSSQYGPRALNDNKIPYLWIFSFLKARQCVLMEKQLRSYSAQYV